MVLDIGTTNIKGFLVDQDLKIQKKIETKNKTFSPQKGYFEQNPTHWFFETRLILEKLAKGKNITALGLATQRETLVSWDKNTGIALGPAILWYDQRTKNEAQKLGKLTDLKSVFEKTGLFWHWRYPAFKIYWLSNYSDEVKRLSQSKRIAFGPPSSWLIYNLTEERKSLIDHTQASRTLLYNLKNSSWDNKLLEIFEIEKDELPQIKPNFYSFGNIKVNNKKIPLLCSVGDQEASLAAHPIEQGITKLTLGTGIFFGQNIGQVAKISKGMETSVCFFGKSPAKALASAGGPRPQREHSEAGEPFYMHEARLSLSGKQIFKAVKSNNKKILEKFKKELIKAIDLFSPQKIYVDGGLIREDIYGEKIRKILCSVSKSFIFQEEIEGTALGVAKILKNSLSN